MIEVTEAARKRLRLVALNHDTTMRDLMDALATVAEDSVLMPQAAAVLEIRRAEKERARQEAQTRRDAEKVGNL